MDKLLYKEKIYTRQRGKWIENSGMVVHEALQKELNYEFAKQLDPQLMTVDDCIAFGDEFKSSTSVWLALKFYEAAIKRADNITMKHILPRITSCYRVNGQPQKAIDIFAYANKKFGQKVVSHHLLTSIAAAYCDLKNYANAKKCCDKAYIEAGKKTTQELSLVYARIKKETDEY